MYGRIILKRHFVSIQFPSGICVLDLDSFWPHFSTKRKSRLMYDQLNYVLYFLRLNTIQERHLKLNMFKGALELESS